MEWIPEWVMFTWLGTMIEATAIIVIEIGCRRNDNG